MKNNLTFIASLILLAYPIFTLPALIKAKQSSGKFFTDSRFIISKAEGKGSSINSKNIFGFFVLLIIGSLLFIYSFHS